MVEIKISPEFSSACHDVTLGCLLCNVKVSCDNELLWNEIDEVCANIASTVRVEKICENAAIAASRKVYRALGKDPARYRLSAEALMRRTVKGYGLYRVNSVVDCLNLVSLSSGFSIGGYDADKISDQICLSVGNSHDQYEGIGRGLLNIDSLPVLRDAVGAFGSPTSDSVRTSVTPDTIRFLMVIFGFGDFENIPAQLDYAEQLMTKHAGATSVEKWLINS